MSQLTVFDFDSTSITVLGTPDRPLFIANEICTALGYKNPWDALAKHVDDRDKVKGDRFEGDPSRIARGDEPANGRQLTLITESGLWSLVMRSQLPGARELARKVTDEILPSIRRTGAYVDPAHPAQAPAVDARERRLMLREERLDRQLKHRALVGLVKTLKESGAYDAKTIRIYELKAAELGAGVDVTPLLPAAPAEPWLSPSQIAAELGVTTQRVGLTITALELRGVEGKSRAMLNKSPHSNREVTSYVYSPEAVDAIREALVPQGVLPC